MQAGVGQGGIAINAYVDNDANGSNNVVYFDARTRQLTDIAVSVAQASVSVARGTQLRFPLITVTNTGSQADDIVVNVPLPSFTSISLVLSSGLCAGVTTLQCSFDSLPAGGSATIDIRMATASEGTFTSNVTMVAENDSTSGNNAVAVDLAVNAPPPPAGGGGSSSGGGAKKGGGSLEWLALAFFGLLVGVRWAFGELAPKRRRRAH
jgi:hypothetical protein